MTPTHEELAQIVTLRGLGYSMEEIEEETGIDRDKVWNYLKALKRKGEKEGHGKVLLETVLHGEPGEAVLEMITLAADRMSERKELLEKTVEEGTEGESEEPTTSP